MLEGRFPKFSISAIWQHCQSQTRQCIVQFTLLVSSILSIGFPVQHNAPEFFFTRCALVACAICRNRLGSVRSQSCCSSCENYQSTNSNFRLTFYEYRNCCCRNCARKTFRVRCTNFCCESADVVHFHNAGEVRLAGRSSFYFIREKTRKMNEITNLLLSLVKK